MQDALWVLVPAFMEGGRVTIHNTHYVLEGEYLIPAAQTPFAQDAAFGYEHSDLRAWVEEKTAGKVKAEVVGVISLEDLRTKGMDHLLTLLRSFHPGQICVANAVNYGDLERLSLALLRLQAEDRKVIFRSAASLVRALSGLAPKSLLGSAALGVKEGGGLVVIGSYVPKTSSQLAYLRKHLALSYQEVDVRLFLDEQRVSHLRKLSQEIDQEIAANKTVVLYTSRELITGKDEEESLAIGNRISSGLIEIVGRLSVSPAFILAKGGITSSDIATKALGIREATVKGQILPGIPVWEPGSESRFPGLPYIVFPGNVGGEDALYEALQKLIS